MKITIFTGNQPRHLSLIKNIAEIADSVFVVQESKTVFPGKINDFFHKSSIMQDYFQKVIDAEQNIFGEISFLPKNVSSLSIKVGDINLIENTVFEPIIDSDLFLVFGASYIKGHLADTLIRKGALNIHMGIAPYFRGSSCNFWALNDGYPELVGATIHKLSKGLDTGEILFHALPKRESTDPFILGMKAVRAAHKGLLEAIINNNLNKFVPVTQDLSQQIRYSKHEEFTDQVAKEYLNKEINSDLIGKKLKLYLKQNLVNTFTY